MMEVLFRPDAASLGFLPEGPIALDDKHISWVGIQHGLDSKTGSINILNLETGENRSWNLSGRPGFAFPILEQAASSLPSFLIGLERSVVRVDLEEDQATESPLSGLVENGVDGTIINDGVACRDGLIFGCKDLTFSEKKAGLYFFDTQTQSLTKLRNDQICSNGKVIESDDEDVVQFLDIDTPTQKVVRYRLDRASQTLSDAEVVLDLTEETGFPDGMVGTPDGSGVIIALFNPNDDQPGMAKWYDLTTGQVEQIWKTDGSPQVTCPLLVADGDSYKLVLTTAAENMSPERLQANPNAGCLFIGETAF